MKLDMDLVKRPMVFRRVGRAYQLHVGGHGDLEHVLALDEAHWVAVSAPVDTLYFDDRYLEWVDHDGDGRIRPFELERSIRWTLQHLSDRSGLDEGATTLRLRALADDGPDADVLRASLHRQLQHLGRSDEEGLELEEIRALVQAEEASAVSEAGVLLPGAVDDEDLAACLEIIRDTTGGTPHPSGALGVAEAQVSTFFEEVEAWVAWREGAAEDQAQVMPFGDDTGALHQALAATQAKVDQYFAQASAAAVDPKVAERLQAVSEHLSDEALTDPAAIVAALEMEPLARFDASGLPLTEGINPAWHARVAALAEGPVERIIGQRPEHLGRAAWERVKAVFAPYAEWLAAYRWQSFQAYAPEQLEHLATPDRRAALEALLEASRAAALDLDAMRKVEALAMNQAYLLRLVNNYVSFPDLYGSKRRALFDSGDVTMDGREFRMAVAVPDHEEHVRVCQGGNICVLYLEVTGEEVEAFEVAVAVTSGGRGNLAVGKRGIFEDNEGRQLDCRVVEIVDNPISLHEAIIAPFKRLGAIVTAKIEGLSDDRRERLEKATEGAAEKVQTASQSPPPATVQTVASAPGGLLAGWGIAIAALGSSMAFITKTLGSLDWLTIVTGLAGAILAVILPAAVVAWIKLRERDLSALLEGSGWAINGRMRVTLTQSIFFTRRPPYPLYARGLGRRWLTWLAVAAAVVFTAMAVWYAAERIADDRTDDSAFPSLELDEEAEDPAEAEPQQ